MEQELEQIRGSIRKASNPEWGVPLLDRAVMGECTGVFEAKASTLVRCWQEVEREEREMGRGGR